MFWTYYSFFCRYYSLSLSLFVGIIVVAESNLPEIILKIQQYEVFKLLPLISLSHRNNNKVRSAELKLTSSGLSLALTASFILVASPGWFLNIKLLYVQEVVTLQKKYLIYLHQKMRFTPFINYYCISRK